MGKALSDVASVSATLGLLAVPRHPCSLGGAEGLLGAGQRQAQRGCGLPEETSPAETAEAPLKISAVQGPTLLIWRTLLSSSCFLRGRPVPLLKEILPPGN